MHHSILERTNKSTFWNTVSQDYNQLSKTLIETIANLPIFFAAIVETLLVSQVLTLKIKNLQPSTLQENHKPKMKMYLIYMKLQHQLQL